MERRRHRSARLSTETVSRSHNQVILCPTLSIPHTSRCGGARCAGEGQMVAVDGRLFRRRRANLNASGLSMGARDNSCPRQSPDASLEGGTHCA